ncbi:hypothetical protein H2201_001057 [Coniosporium apollinis]|uniref:FAD-binding PCMH-type domain-containing protein n=1 Tax=Coniosporium apollinis TaxID=61459 RepID=A0ABQ9P649_9PEZI|nr:hypothetical protein H2201_001057 [Coniosporium apollinis]
MGSVPGNAPTRENLERTHILHDILDNVDRYSDEYDKVDYDALKRDVLKPVLHDDFDPEVQIRGFLRAFRHTPAFRAAFENIRSPELQNQVQAFIRGSSAKEAVGKEGFRLSSHPSPGVKHHFSLIDELQNLVLGAIELKEAVEDVFHPKHAYVKALPLIYEDAASMKVMEVYCDVPFENWGQSVHNTPRLTCLPTTVRGVQNIVQYASENNLRVRCAGYRHSWSSVFSQDNEIFISFVNLEQVTTIPDPMSLLPGEYNPATVTELKTIELQEKTAPGKRLCRIGAAVTNEEFRRWAVANDSWSLPVDVILVEVTIGGVNAPICHGGGRPHKTVSDYVRRIEYVDCNGALRLIDDPYLIKAAAGAFGLLGVVTHITFELDAMSYAVMEPRKVDIGLAIPPLSKEEIPKALREDWFYGPKAAQKLAAAKVDFEKRAADDFYSEWFWFTYQRKAWVNTWNTTSDPVGAKDYPDEARIFLQWVEGWIGGVLTSHPFFNAIPGYWQAQLLATMGMAALPPTLGEKETPTIKTQLPNALHFRRGIQNMRVRDMEFQIPLQPRQDDPTKPDFWIVQKAWWDVINLVYDYADASGDPSSPMRLTLELRIMGGSDMLMAPQKGNDLGTASIEVLSIPDAVADDEWRDFIQKVSDLWMSYGDHINVRPHWAKEWEGLQFKGRGARDHLRDVAYPEQIVEFKEALGEIGRQQGWSLEQLQNRFSNELWDKIVYGM